MSIFTELAEHSRVPFTAARMLPPAAYTSAEVLAEEHRRIFACEWMCVGRAADVPNRGDYLTAEIPVADPVAAGRHRSIIVVRGDDDRLGAFDNVCVHRGSPLLDGCGNQARITCPYHAWVYRLDGQLIGAPYMEIEAADHHLTRVRLEEWEGFLFVTQDPSIAPVGERLRGLTQVVGRYRMAGYVPVHRQVDVWDTNWKLLYENFMDAYHVFKVHKNSFAKNGDNTGLTTMHSSEEHDGGDHCAYHLVGHAPDAKSGVAHPDNTSLDGEWRNTIVLGAAFPTHVMQLQPDWLWYLQLSPLGVGRVRIRWDVSVAPEVLADQAHPQAYVDNLLALLNLVNSEDRPIVEGVFRGVHNPNLTRGPLSYLEQNVFEFDRYIARTLAC
ncbi:MAG TPA: aromatic ring-hydroxylating dioxygenase subunit alpha [Ilumatobacteraceae bacterium]|nr:aromatic ring-hydroxylating dioxygenase subunit alpha [Ilumatobacteraceae bacterium]